MCPCAPRSISLYVKQSKVKRHHASHNATNIYIIQVLIPYDTALGGYMLLCAWLCDNRPVLAPRAARSGVRSWSPTPLIFETYPMLTVLTPH